MSDLKVIEGEKPYTVRRLNAGDSKRVGAMLAKVTGDPRLTNALASGEQSVILAAAVAVLLEKVPRDISVWCADLTGITKKYDFKEYRKAARAEAKEENLLPPTDEQIRYAMEEEIIEEMDSFPVNAYVDIVHEVMERDEFNDFLLSCQQFGETAKMLSSRFQSLSSEDTDSQTEKS